MHETFSLSLLSSPFNPGVLKLFMAASICQRVIFENKLYSLGPCAKKKNTLGKCSVPLYCHHSEVDSSLVRQQLIGSYLGVK